MPGNSAGQAQLANSAEGPIQIVGRELYPRDSLCTRQGGPIWDKNKLGAQSLHRTQGSDAIWWTSGTAALPAESRHPPLAFDKVK